MMLPLRISHAEAAPARVIAIGAHPDDIELGCAGTILKLIEQEAVAEVRWVVLSVRLTLSCRSKTAFAGGRSTIS